MVARVRASVLSLVWPLQPYLSLWLFAVGCSIADELFTSFQQLLTLADRKGVKYDRCATKQPDIPNAACKAAGSDLFS